MSEQNEVLALPANQILDEDLVKYAQIGDYIQTLTGRHDIRGKMFTKSGEHTYKVVLLTEYTPDK
ncbi:hypothetical protein [Pseudomonas sp. HMWF021]|uniref:hypothetical protein n=1 Tax=Pseudomonas sp. HMWF021 TaxID=2056857 RepID=UPI000D385EF4|nr:hypothetical protein [Pseudomonas sp. HMWF021]PTT28056.1 hypothetical protein DBR18_17720 [Pseudomonas sp. HMWF021]